MKEICFSETAVEGGQGLNLQIPVPEIHLHTYQGEPSMVHNVATGALEYPIIPERKTAYLDIAVLALPAEGIVTAGQIVDLSGKMSSAGALPCDLPDGKWKIYRFGHTIMGNGLHPAQSKARGFECDKMSREAMGFHLDHIIGDIRKHVWDLIGTGLTHVHFDSYEAGTPSWTSRMREEFSSRRKYDRLTYLPTFAKRTINREQETQKFKQDFNATIKDLYSDVYFATIQQKLHGAGLDFLCEPYGGPWRQDDLKATHRSDGTTDIFFVANTRHVSDKAACAFAMVGKQPELWDPVTATLRDLPEYTVTNGTTVVPMQFEPAQSFFVVFRKPGYPQHRTDTVNFPALCPVAELTGAWQVQFDPQWGGPVKPVTFTTLTDWTRNSIAGIKSYSGTAVYRQIVDGTPDLPNKTVELFYQGFAAHAIRIARAGADHDRLA